VTAMEKSSGVEASIEVKPSYGLTDSEVEGMLRASLEHAQDDMDARRLREQQVEAKRVIEALGAALAADGEQLMTPEEMEPIKLAFQQLIGLSESDDHEAIKEAIEALEKSCEFYVERRMNANIQKAMAGHSVDEFETK